MSSDWLLRWPLDVDDDGVVVNYPIEISGHIVQDNENSNGPRPPIYVYSRDYNIWRLGCGMAGIKFAP